MKKFILLLIIPLLCLGQSWERTFGGTADDIGHCVQQTTDGGFIISGIKDFDYPYSNCGSIYLIKTDENGYEQWSQTYGEIYSSYDSRICVQQTSDGGYIISGGGKNPFEEPDDSYLIKTDEIGNEQWAQDLGGMMHNVRFVQQTSDGGYIVTGIATGGGTGLIKTDENGNLQWGNSFEAEETSTYSEGNCVQQTSDGGYIIVGTKNMQVYNTELIDSDLLIVKTDENGNEQWSGMTDFGIRTGHFVQQTLDGGYIVTGSCPGTNSTNDPYNILLLKIDEDGSTMWDYSFDNLVNNPILNNVDQGRCVRQTNDEAFVWTGWVSYPNSTSYVSVMKRGPFWSNGSSQSYDDVWEMEFGDSGSVNKGYSIQQTSDGGYIVVGVKNLGNGMGDVYLIKIDGNISSSIEHPTSKKELIKKINILGQENITIKNQPMIEIYDDGSVEKKYVIE